MTVHKIKYAGKVYRGVQQKDGSVVFDPPLPEEYVRSCESRMQDALTSQAFPGLNTDTTFLANRGTLEQQFEGDKDALEKTVKKAQQHGYKPKHTDVYLSGLARFPGDPQAFVGGNDAKGHIAKLCKDRGIGCRGSVNVPEPEKRISPEEAVKRDAKKVVKKRGAVS